MDDHAELPLCRQPKKSTWQQVCQFFSQNPFGQILINFVSSFFQYVFLVALACWCGSKWHFSYKETLDTLKRKLDKYKKENLELKAELEKQHETKPDDSRATSNPCDPSCNISMDRTQETISAQRRNSISRRVCNSTVNSVEEKVIENQGEITAEVTISIPESPKSAKVESIVQKSEILGDAYVSIRGSRILEDKVTVGDDILDKLSGLADSCTKVDNGVTVKLGDCRIFIRTGT